MCVGVCAKAEQCGGGGGGSAGAAQGLREGLEPKSWCTKNSPTRFSPLQISFVLTMRSGWVQWGLGWVGSWLAPVAGSHGQCVLPSPARLGPTPAVWSHSPPRLLTTPEPHRGAGGREMPPCLCVVRTCRGGAVGGFRAQWCTFVLLQRGVQGCIGGGGGGYSPLPPPGRPAYGQGCMRSSSPEQVRRWRAPAGAGAAAVAVVRVERDGPGGRQRVPPPAPIVRYACPQTPHATTMCVCWPRATVSGQPQGCIRTAGKHLCL